MQLPLVSTQVFRPINRVIEDIGSPAVARRAWRAVGLSADILREQPVFLPYQTQAAFIEHAARELGERHFGAIIG